MLKHQFKIIWNDRKRFFGIFIEQILVFIILMISIVSISIAVDKYNEPGLLETDDVIFFGYSSSDYNNPELDEISRKMDEIVERLRRNPNVRFISNGDEFAPYLRDDDYNKTDSVAIDNKKIKVYIKYSDRYGAAVFAPKIVEGEWLSDKKLPDGSAEIIITRAVADQLNWEKAVGRKVTIQNMNYTVVGVIEALKQNVFSKAVPVIIQSMKETNHSNFFRELSAKVDDKELFATDFHNEWNRSVKSDIASTMFVDLENAKNSSISELSIDIVMMSVPTLFLLIFAFIGAFGLFWLNSQKRMKEFALRLAVGSTVNELKKGVIMESIIVTTLSMVPGVLLSLFIYEITVVRVVGIVVTVAIMFLFAIFSAWYPAQIVSKINPAQALNYE